MDLWALRCFVEVAERRNFTRAAEALFVTQPTITKMLQQLEAEVGSPLLSREGRHINLTPIGELVLKRAREMLALKSQLESEISDREELRSGELVIGIPPLGGELLTPVMSAFHARYPGVELRLFETGSNEVETKLRRGEVDIGALLLPVNREEFSVLSVYRCPLCVITRPDTQWAKRAAIALHELANETFIFYGEGFALNEIVMNACRESGFQPRIGGRSSQWDFMTSMVEAGVGVAILPALYGSRLSRSRFSSVLLKSPKLTWHLGMAWRAQGQKSRAAEAWISLSREVLGNKHPKAADAK